MPSDDEYGHRQRDPRDEYGGERDLGASPGAGSRAASHAAPWPGKRSLTQRLAAPYASSPAPGSAAAPAPAVHRKAAGDAVAADAQDRLSAAGASSGHPLPGELRERFEASTGADLSSVRVHTGAESHAAASAVSARAYAVGQDIYFGAGHYDPSSPDGQHLIAHEVAHTVQQHAGAPVRQHKLAVSAPGDAAEVEADRAADAMVTGAPATITSASPMIARDPPKEQAKDPATPGDDINAPPPQYAKLDPRVRDLLWRSKDSYEPFTKVAAKPFWEKLDQLGVADLQTCVQVLAGADKAGLLGSIQKLVKVYTYGSSWGLEFTGPTPAVGYPSWGYDLQWFVRREHGDEGGKAHNWYRQASGAGNAGMHVGVDAGAGFHNLHWDPTNPMDHVANGSTPESWIGIFPIIPPKGQAIYSAAALIEHAQDIGKLPKWGETKVKPTANQPFLDISILSNDFADKAKLYADMEAGAAAEQRDKARADAAIAKLRAASAAAKALSGEARPIAMQDNESNKPAVDDLATKAEAVKAKMWDAFANVFAHLHAELTSYTEALGGFDTVAEWSMATKVHDTYGLFALLLEERGRRLKAMKEKSTDTDPMDGGVGASDSE